VGGARVEKCVGDRQEGKMEEKKASLNDEEREIHVGFP